MGMKAGSNIIAFSQLEILVTPPFPSVVVCEAETQATRMMVLNFIHVVRGITVCKANTFFLRELIVTEETNVTPILR